MKCVRVGQERPRLYSRNQLNVDVLVQGTGVVCSAVRRGNEACTVLGFIFFFIIVLLNRSFLIKVCEPHAESS